ncbi:MULTISPECIES: DUF4190 domain-containing protein [unclassified Streptomyces]|uniref:DUF4190 domain-containing protein n=1 Tax=unclassified Streptomyces TaxID=2593676 RepID=UPI000F79A557|nr:DUF4190 domain-containing protein [Streptomyces sp. WAC01280]RSS55841.1 DUF4190 domain-containing protein [Streptomyces sp. WAC01280]
MSDNRDQPQGGYDPADPWAPPNRDGVELSKPTPATPPVHDQQTVTSMPAASDVPPPPVAPGGPAATPGYGYPAATPPAGAYGYPAATPPAATPPTASGYAYPSYGAGYGQPPGWQQPSNGMGIASMVLGIVAVVGFCLYGLNIILGILALIFGIIGLKKAGRGEATNRGMALAGVILGAVGIVVGAVILGLIIWAGTQGSSYEEGSDDPFASVLQIERDGR